MSAGPILEVSFYRSANGREPVREFLHAFRKKSQKTPVQELALARSRLQDIRGNA